MLDGWAQVLKGCAGMAAPPPGKKNGVGKGHVGAAA